MEPGKHIPNATPFARSFGPGRRLDKILLTLQETANGGNRGPSSNEAIQAAVACGSDLSAYDKAKDSTLHGYADDVVEIGRELVLKDAVFSRRGCRPPALDALKQGTLLGTVLNDAKNQGKATFDLAAELGSGKTTLTTVVPWPMPTESQIRTESLTPR